LPAAGTRVAKDGGGLYRRPSPLAGRPEAFVSAKAAPCLCRRPRPAVVLRPR